MDNNNENLYFITDEGEQIYVDAFLIEKAKSDSLEYFGVEETEDETIARHLTSTKNKIRPGYPESPHLILPDLASRNGGLNPFVLTGWLSSSLRCDRHISEKIVVVVFVDAHPDKTIQELFDMCCHQINFKVLANIDQAEERRLFDWYLG